LALVPIGILSSPGPLQVLALDAPNYVTTNWPVVSGPVFHVPLGIILHFYTFAQLRYLRQQDKGDRQPSPQLRPREAFIVGAVGAGWLLTIIMLARQHFFVLTPQTALPPPIGIAVALPIIAGYLAFRYWGAWRQFILALPLTQLIGLQIFRILSILVLIQFALDALPAPFALPVGMGGILIGFSALLVADFYDPQKVWSRRLAIGWNWVGIVDLTLAIVLGLFTSPIRVQFLALDAPNRLITDLPMVLFPTIIVPIGILLHIYTLVRLTQSDTTSRTPAPSLAWLVMFYGAVVASLYVVIFYIAAPLVSDRPIGFQIYAGLQQIPAANPISLYVHIIPALLTLLIGPFQLLEGFRTRHWKLHRWLGRTYLVSVVLGGLGALYMAQFSFAGLGARLGFSVQAILLLFTGYMAYRHIRRREIDTHREWMFRNYALIFGAVTLRLYIRAGFELGYDLPDFHAVNAWLCWIPNLLVAEWLIHHMRTRRAGQGQPLPAPELRPSGD
jgi:uncharacterized membrane protein